MASLAYLEGFYSKPRIDRELLEQYHEGIICLSGCVSSEFSQALLQGRRPGANISTKPQEIAAWFHKIFGDRYFIEIQNNGLEIQRRQMEGAVEVARRMGMPLVATSDAHYVNQEDSDAQDVLLCINTGKFRTDTNRMRMETNQFHLRSPEEMYAAFPGLDEALKQSQLIADSVNIELELGKRHFPNFTPPESKTPADYLRELCLQGLRERYADKPEALDRRRAGPRSAGPARPRTERHQHAGLSQLLSDRLGFRPLRPRARHSGHRARLGRRLARGLRAVSEPRLPAGVQFAVRAVFGHEPPRSARYRHRFLQGSPRRGDPIRQGQIRRRERRPDRHVRHAGRAGGHPRRRPALGDAHSARRCRRGHGARRVEHHAGRSA